MRSFDLTRVHRIESEDDRLKALHVLKTTYLHEKRWVADVEPLFPAADLERGDISWFLALRKGQPVGVLRILYDPDIQQYRNFGLKAIDASLSLDAFMNLKGLAEVGRFAVVPERRKGVDVALHLIAAATSEVVGRGYTQLVTDVFENDAHSPLGFHTRILGFKPVATHEVGELLHKGRRVTLMLDIRRSYQALKANGNWFFRALTRNWTQSMHMRLA